MPTALQMRTKKTLLTAETDQTDYEEDLANYKTARATAEEDYWNQLTNRFFMWSRKVGGWSENNALYAAERAVHTLKKDPENLEVLRSVPGGLGVQTIKGYMGIARAYGPFTYPTGPKSPKEIREKHRAAKFTAIKMRGRGSRRGTILTDTLGLTDQPYTTRKTLLGA